MEHNYIIPLVSIIPLLFIVIGYLIKIERRLTRVETHLETLPCKEQIKLCPGEK